MLTETFSSIVTAVRRVFANWRALLLVAIVYVALLVALYFFVAVREASVAQVVLTFALALLAPILFFFTQPTRTTVLRPSRVVGRDCVLLPGPAELTADRGGCSECGHSVAWRGNR